MARKLIVEIVGDASSLERSFARAEKSTKGFGRSMEGAGRGAIAGSGAFKSLGRSVAFASGGFLTGAGLVAGFKSSISAASDLNEQMSKTNQVFGASAQQITDWSQTTATAMGISKREALGVASSFGALFAPMGITGEKAAEQSKKLTQLGADLASFYNTNVSDALDAIRSGIVGESEPLRRYGVLLSETRVQAEALAETHKQSAKDLTAAEKAAARITLIMKDASQAEGDFARTSGGLANQSRELRAQLDDLQTNVGTYYVPALTKLARAANSVFETLNQASAEQSTASIREQVTLVPKLAHEWSVMRDHGIAAGDAIEFMERQLGGSAKAADLLAQAINYAAGGPAVANIARLNQQIKNLGVDADTAAKQMHGLAAETAAVAAAAPTGLAALTAAQANQLELAKADATPGTADNLTALAKRREILAKQIKFITGRLKVATGGTARNLAKTLAGLYDDDKSAYDKIAAINQAAAANAAAAAAKIKAAAAKIREANKAAAAAAKAARQAATERQFAWLDFAVERAEATKTPNDNRAAYRAREAFLKDLIRQEGRTVQLVRSLWETREKIRQLNADAAKAAGEAKTEAAQKKLQRQFGWLEFAVERAEATKNITERLRTNRALEKAIKDRIRHEGRTLDLTRQLWQVRQKILNLNKQKSEQITPNLGAVGGPRLAALLARGLGVGAAGRIEQTIAGMKLTAVTLDNRIVLDGQLVARSVNTHNARSGRRTAQQTSGYRG